MPDDLEQRLTLFKREVLKRYFPHAGDFQADQARALAKNAPTVTRASSRESGLALLIAFVSAVLGIVCICIVSFEWQKAPASTTAFDGKYIGVSRESSKTASAPDAECPPPERPSGSSDDHERRRPDPWEGVVGRDRQPARRHGNA